MKINFARLTKATRSGIGLALVLSALSAPAWAVPHVPEIDPGSMGSALTLLFAGAMVLSRRFRKS